VSGEQILEDCELAGHAKHLQCSQAAGDQLDMLACSCDALEMRECAADVGAVCDVQPRRCESLHATDADGSQRKAPGQHCLDQPLGHLAAMDRLRQEFAGPVSVVASSFGAVSVLLSLPYLTLGRLALWNPILDLRHTFLEPELPWGKENFGAVQQQHLMDNGFLVVDGEFELGRVLFEEFRRYTPATEILASTVPTLIVHGDKDSYVSYDIAKAIAQARGCDFHRLGLGPRVRHGRA